MDRAGTPLVLVDHGQRIEGEIGFPWQQGVDTRRPLRGQFATREGRGQAETQVAVTALLDHESDAAAREWCVALQPALATYSGRTTTLLLEIQGGSRYELSGVSLDAVEAGVRPAPCARTEASYQLTGGAWAELPEPGVHPLPSLHIEMAEDSDASWMEVSFISPDLLTGSASAGWVWTGGGQSLTATLEQSTDLQTWSLGQFQNAPGYPVAVAGGWEYRGRSLVPSKWKNVMCDLTISSARGGKSIDSLTVKNAPVSLPGYPYPMPAAAATLQSHLRAAGFPGALVTVATRPQTFGIRNHTPTIAAMLQVVSGVGGVTSVRAYSGGAWNHIPLPAYPYAIPSSQSTLQSHLRAAGFTGAVVRLFASEWTIQLPNIPAGAFDRNISLTFTPPDPAPYWDSFGVYQGLTPDNGASGDSGNVRTPAGAPLAEAARQFARLRVTPTPP